MLAPALPWGVKTVSGQSVARVFVDPPIQTVGDIGDSFTVNVSIANVSNLFGWEFKLYYDSTIMNGTQATQGSFLKSGGGQTLFIVVNFTDQYNPTYGVCWISCLLTGQNVPGVNGGGVLATIEFKSLAPADSVPLHLADVKLSDPNGPLPSTFDTTDGAVTVAAIYWWPMFHRELTHTGYSTSTAPNTNQTLWNYTTGASVLSSPAVAGGIVYVGSDNKVYALFASTGALVWSYTIGSYVESSPAVADGMVFVGSDDGNVTALNATATNSAFIWNYTTDGPVFSSPAVAGGRVFVGSVDNVYALNEMTGTRLWNYSTSSQVASSPAVAGGVVFVGSDGGNVYALNASTGALVWSYTIGSYVESSPAVADGMVFVGSGDGNVTALNATATNSAFIWNYTTDGPVFSSPAVAGGRVFVGSEDGKVYALNEMSGAQIWNYTTGNLVDSSPAVAGGIVFVGSYDGNVYALNASTGTLVWSYAIDGSIVFSSPAVAGGRVFVSSTNGNVSAFGPAQLAVSILPLSPAAMDVGQSQTFTSTVSGGIPPYTYQWYQNGTAVLGATSSSWAFIPSSSGFYTVYVNVTDNVGLSAKSNIASVTVNSALIVSVSPTSVTMDVGQFQLFTSSVSGGSSNYDYQWCLNGANFSGATGPTWNFTPSSSGSYSVYLNVTDTVTSFRAESNTASVTVNPPLSVIVTETSVSMGVGQSHTFNSSVSGGSSPYSYRWYLDGVAVSGATKATWTFIPSFAGTYAVYVNVTDSVGGRAKSNTATVTVAAVDWWPMFHHDLTHTGYSTSTAPNTNQTLWTYTTGSAVYSSPAVFGGMVYVGSDKVYALNASTGSLVWSYTTGSYMRSSPAVFGGMVYVGSDKVYALNASTGSLVWSYTTGGQVYSSPVVADGRVYVGSSDSRVYALDVSTGALVWNYTTGASVVSSPTVVGGVVFVGSEDNRVYALNEMSGAQIWNYTTGNLVDSSPAVAGGMVFVGSYDGNVYAMNASTGAYKWNYTTGNWVASSPAVAGGTVYVGSTDGKVYALNAATGAYLWNYTTGDSVYYSSPAVAGGMVFVGSYDGNVYAMNAITGARAWSYTTGAWVVSSPAVVGGVVFVGSYDGNVYAFGIVPLVVSISPSSVVMDVGQSQLFTSSVTGGISPYTYQWFLNDTPVSGATGATWTFTPDSSNSFAVYLNVVDNVGLSAKSNIVSITVSGALSVNVTPTNVTMDARQSRTFTSTVSGGIPPYTYQWYLNGTAYSGATSLSWAFIPSSSGFYTVYVNVTDKGGLMAKSDIASVTVNPELSVSVSPTSVTMGVSESQLFTSSVSGGAPTYSYQWTLNGSLVSTSGTWNFIATSAGFYMIYLNVTDAVGAQAKSNTATANVTLVAVDWWPMFHHDLTHTGNSTSTAPNTNQTLWTYTTGSAVYSSPAVFGGMVYVGSDRVYALYASTGAPIWTYRTDSQVYSSPAVAGGIVYVGADRVYALNASTGASVWNYTTGGQVYSSPAVTGGMVYVGSYGGNVSALSAANGASVWNYTTGSAVYSSPAVTGGMVYVSSLGGNVSALNAGNGALVWNYTTGASVYSSPAVAGGVVFVGSYDGKIYALNAANGTQIWNYTTGSAVDSSPAVAGRTVYVGSDRVYALYASTGAFLWSYTAGVGVRSSPAVVGGVVFVGSDDSKVYAFTQLPLSASISSSSSVMDVGQSQLFTSSVTGGTSIYTYQWYRNGSLVSGATNPTWTFNATSAGSYTVYLKVTDSASAVATSNTVPVTVNGPLSIRVTPSSVTMDMGQSQSFISTVSGGTSPFNFQWYLDGTAVPSATSSTWTFTPSSSGSHNVYVNVTDNAGSIAKSNITTVTVNPAISANISPTSVTLNVGQSQLFTSSVSGGASPYSYQWYLNNASVSGATSSSWTFTPLSGGSYTIYVKVSDGVGGQATSNTATATVAGGGGPYTLTMYTVGQGSVLPGNGTYASGTHVNITAITAAGWLFAGWGGGASGLSNMTIILNGNTVVTATFTQTSYALTMYTVGQGSVLPGNASYASGANVDIKAISAAGWLFAGWSGNVTGLSNMTIAMTGNMFVTATFTQGTFSLTMYTVGQGSVQPGNGTYLAGTSVNITAITVAGWAFQGWSGNAFGLSNTTIVMNGNMFVTATFSQVVAGHDVAVTNIASGKTSIGQGFFSNVTVTIGNLGSFAETFNVTVYANQTVIATFVNTTLASGSFTSLWFMWNTTAFTKGNYTISAFAGPVPGDVNTANNLLSSGPVAVTIIGDLNGDFKVSLADLTLLAKAYGSNPSSANWNPNADIDGNGAVGLIDLVNLAVHYGQHFP
jgi:outer membrane protein assembly factor BamB